MIKAGVIGVQIRIMKEEIKEFIYKKEIEKKEEMSVEGDI